MSHIIVIFGISGDLSKRKLLPALYHLVRMDLLPNDTKIVGITRQDISVNSLINTDSICSLEPDHLCDTEALKRFQQMLDVFKMDLVDPGDYQKLASYLQKIESSHGKAMNRLIYLSIPPQVFGPIVRNLGESGLNKPSESAKFCHLLVEKPFGYDATSARELIAVVDQYFSESQVYRIDHYLAKETAQNILAFRFNNPIFESIWDSKHVKQITVTATESIGIEGRTIFYEQTGALRDLIQSHLLQLLSMVTMEKPISSSSGDVHKAKVELLRSIEPIRPDAVEQQSIRGQYYSYRHEVNNQKSISETYAALKLEINNNRWRGTPIYIQTGKGLAEKRTSIQLVFSNDDSQNNTLTFNLQPQESIEIDLRVKRPGYGTQIETTKMDFHYERSFAKGESPDAYERVLVDALNGDSTLFATRDEVMATWDIIESVVQNWQNTEKGLAFYKKGTDADDLIKALSVVPS